MRLINETDLVPGWLIGRVPPHALSATVVLKGTYRLVPGGPAEPVEKPDPLAGDVPEADDSTALRYTRDLELSKSAVDLLLAAVAFAPGGRPVATLPVTVELGRWSKSLAVVGERSSKRGILKSTTTEPEPFTRMPLTWVNAYGGPGFGANPAGRGLDTILLPDGSKAHRLPTVEPWDVVKHGSTSGRAEPASFAPVAPTWAPRMNKAKSATWNSKWLKDNWPALPRDFDWSYFNAAPPDQQLALGSLRGDERLRMVNLHPDHPEFVSALPGIRPRWFVRESSGEFHEVPLALDTVWISPHEQKLILVWRGVTGIRSKGMKEVAEHYVLSEPVSSRPLAASEVQARLARRVEAIEAEAKAPSKIPPLEIPPLQPMPPPFDWTQWEKNFRKDMAAAQQQADLDAASVAADIEKGHPVDVFKAHQLPTRMFSAPPPDPKTLNADLLQSRAALAKDKPELAKALGPPPLQGGKPPKEMEPLIRELDEWNRKPVSEDPPPPEPEPAGWTRERVLVEAKAGRKFAGEDLSGIDLSDADLAGVDFSECVLAGARLTGARAAGARFAKTVLTDADLAGVDFQGAVLDNADATGVKGANACFDGASLVNAILAKADFRGASFRDANAENLIAPAACFAEAVLTGARISSAVLDDIVLERADLRQADLSGTICGGARASGARFDGARLVNFRGSEGADFTGASFVDCEAEGAVFERARLDGATFVGSNLRKATFAEASLKRADLSGCELPLARLPEADLEDAHFAHANLFRAHLEGAKLVRTDFRSANLYEAEFLDCEIVSPCWLSANLTGTKLAGT